MTIELPYKFTPREYQKDIWRAIVDQGVKRAVCVWHRRAGKDKTFLNIVVAKAMETMANYAYYFPTAALARKAMWDNIDARSGMRVIDHIPKELIARPNETQMKITLVNGSTIQLLGTDNLDVVGGNYYGIIFSESAQHNPLAWDLIRPILAENGGWALFNGTPRGKNWFHRLYSQAQENPAWFAQKLTVDDTGAISAADIQAERDAKMSEDMIRQEFFCDFNAANPGAIYARLIEKAREEGRIGKFPVADSLVHTSWDLGSPANTSVWYWQVVGAEIRVIDCDVGIVHGAGGEPVSTAVQRVAYMKSKPYNYGTHFLPHDAKQTERTGSTFETDLRKAGFTNVQVLPVTHDIWDGIRKLQGHFPALAFRSPQCDQGIEALESYHTREVEPGKLVQNEPVHDWSSHIADSLRYMAEAIHHKYVKVGATVYNRGDLDPWGEPRRKRRGAIADFRG